MSAPRGRIMIVEDESLVAEDLQNCLSRSGYEVVGIADTFAGAKSMAETERPDLVLLDIRLKGPRDGIELAGELRRRDIGYVYLTSHSDEGTLARAEVTEPLGYVLKPFGPREMLPVLRTAMYRHAAEVRQRGLEQWLRTTLRSIGDGVLVTDEQTRVTYANPAAEQMLGRTLRELTGAQLRDVLSVVVPGSRTPPPCVAARALASGANVYLEPDAELVRPDGSRLPIDDCAAPIREADGTISGVVVVLRDATARRQAERQRREAERRMQDAERLESLGVLASGLAHDLNNILTAILGNASLCRDLDPASARAPLAEIEAHARAAAELCRRMLAGAGAAPVAPLDVDVLHAVEQCVARERALAPAEVALVVAPPAQPVRVHADELQLRQVVQNLVRNAVEALAGRTGTIRVQWAATELPAADVPDGSVARRLGPGRYVRLEVVDDGPGMTADVLSRAFEPFFTTKFTGRGLGLASVHGIVRRHGGGIEAESVPGAGACVRLYWPTFAAAVGNGAPPRAAPKEKPKAVGSVLVVDDDPAVRHVTCQLLRNRGWRCEEAGSGDHALALLRGGVAVDGVLLDMTMPGMSTDEVLAALRALQPRLPVLLVSGNTFAAEAREQDPLVDFLAKPFAVGELVERLARWRRTP